MYRAARACPDTAFKGADIVAAQRQVEGGHTVFAGAKFQQQCLAMRPRHLRLGLQGLDTGLLQQGSAQQQYDRLPGGGREL